MYNSSKKENNTYINVKMAKGECINVKKRWIVSTIIIIFILSIFSIIASLLLNFFMSSSVKKNDSMNQVVLAQENKNSVIGETVDTNASDATVSPNAQVIITETYRKCGHTITKKEVAPREIINLTKDKVQEYYEDFNIESFTSNEIKLSKTYDGICAEHYVLKESDGYISISARNDIGEYIFFLPSSYTNSSLYTFLLNSTFKQSI